MIETITVDGKDYTVDDFEGRELVDAEQAFGISLTFELDRVSMQGIYALMYLIKRRENPGFTRDDALALKLGDVMKMVGGGDDEAGEVPPPNRAARRAKQKAGSTDATSGTPSS
jgi:hypothetical protein